MKFEMHAYIAIDRESNLREGENAYANRGAILYPIGATVPVIRTNPQRCIGTAYIKSFEITSNLTEVRFTFAPMDFRSEVARAYLALYLNTKTENADDDPYDGAGFIPGAMGIGGGDDIKEPVPKKNKSRYRGVSSLSDMLDDDDDDY